MLKLLILMLIVLKFGQFSTRLVVVILKNSAFQGG